MTDPLYGSRPVCQPLALSAVLPTRQPCVTSTDHPSQDGNGGQRADLSTADHEMCQLPQRPPTAYPLQYGGNTMVEHGVLSIVSDNDSTEDSSSDTSTASISSISSVSMEDDHAGHRPAGGDTRQGWRQMWCWPVRSHHHRQGRRAVADVTERGRHRQRPIPLSRWEASLQRQHRQLCRRQRGLLNATFCLTLLPLMFMLPPLQPFWAFIFIDALLLAIVWISIIWLQVQLRRVEEQRRRAHALRHVFRRQSSGRQPHHHGSNHHPLPQHYPAWPQSSDRHFDPDRQCWQLHLRSDDPHGPDPNAISPNLLALPPPAYIAATREPPAYQQPAGEKPPHYHHP